MLPGPRYRGLTTMRTLFTCSLKWEKKGASALWYSELSLHQLGSRPTVFIPRWTTHHCILYQVCATRGAASLVGFFVHHYGMNAAALIGLTWRFKIRRFSVVFSTFLSYFSCLKSQSIGTCGWDFEHPMDQHRELLTPRVPSIYLLDSLVNINQARGAGYWSIVSSHFFQAD